MGWPLTVMTAETSPARGPMVVPPQELPAKPTSAGPLDAALASGLPQVLGIFLINRALLLFVGWLASIIIPIDIRTRPFDPALGVYWLDIWAQGDVGAIIGIAVDGYRGAAPERLAHFPLYPLWVSLVQLLAGNAFLAGVIVSNVAFLVALFLMYQLTRDHFDDASIATRSVLYLALYPGVVFTMTAYPDALFLALALATFLLLSRQLWALAGLIGAFAAATKVTGIVLAAAWLAEYVQVHLQQRARPGLAAVAVLLIPSGLAVVILAFYLLVNDPLAFLRPAAWNGIPQPIQFWGTVQWALELAQGQHLVAGFEERYALNLINLIAGALFAILIPFIAWRIGLSYALYVALGLIVSLSLTPLDDRPLEGLLRSSVTFFPAFMLLASWGRQRPVDWLVTAVFSIVLGLVTALYVTSWFPA